MSHHKAILALVCILLVCNIMSGCLIVANTQRSHHGAIPASRTMREIELGTTTSTWLIAAVGSPASRTTVDEHTQLLRYERVTTVRKETTVFLILSANDKVETHDVTVFEVTDGVIQRYWTE